MRIWDIDPGYLNRQSLLGEHRELHGMVVVLMENRKGYSFHPETRRWNGHLTALSRRHDLLVEEMRLRGYNHHSPLSGITGDMKWPTTFIDPPHVQFAILKKKYRDKEPGRIPLPTSAGQLWAQHKYSVLCRDPRLYRLIGPWIATRDDQIRFKSLAALLVRTLRQHPLSTGRLRNGLEHMWGYVSHLTRQEAEQPDPYLFLQMIRELVVTGGSVYLKESTVLGEIGAWLHATHNGNPPTAM